MPKSRKFRKNSIDYKIEFPDPIQKALIKAKRDVPFTEFAKEVLPKPKTMVYYYQKNHGKYREPSIVIFNQKIQGKSRKMGRRPSIGKHKKTRRNRSKKYRRGMMGGNPPKKPEKPQNPTPVNVQGQGTNLGPHLAQEQTSAQIGQRDLSREINSE